MLGLGYDGVHRDGRLARGAVANDEFALAAANRNHRVNGHDAGLHRHRYRFALDDTGRDFFHRIVGGRGDGALAIDRLAQGIDDAAEQCLTDRDGEQLAGGAAFVALFDGRIVAEQNHPDLVFLEVEGHAGDPATKLDHFIEHHVGEAFDLGDAIAHLTDNADVGFFDGRGDARDLLFEFLEDAAHK